MVLFLQACQFSPLLSLIPSIIYSHILFKHSSFVVYDLLALPLVQWLLKALWGWELCWLSLSYRSNSRHLGNAVLAWAISSLGKAGTSVAIYKRQSVWWGTSSHGGIWKKLRCCRAASHRSLSLAHRKPAWSTASAGQSGGCKSETRVFRSVAIEVNAWHHTSRKSAQCKQIPGRELHIRAHRKKVITQTPAKTPGSRIRSWFWENRSSSFGQGDKDQKRLQSRGQMFAWALRRQSRHRSMVTRLISDPTSWSPGPCPLLSAPLKSMGHLVTLAWSNSQGNRLCSQEGSKLPFTHPLFCVYILGISSTWLNKLSPKVQPFICVHSQSPTDRQLAEIVRCLEKSLQPYPKGHTLELRAGLRTDQGCLRTGQGLRWALVECQGAHLEEPGRQWQTFSLHLLGDTMNWRTPCPWEWGV